VQQCGIRGGEFDEFEAVDAQGIFLNFGHDFLRRVRVRKGLIRYR
jgi:hypothetical protein